jgi:hypothetical protein
LRSPERDVCCFRTHAKEELKLELPHLAIPVRTQNVANRSKETNYVINALLFCVVLLAATFFGCDRHKYVPAEIDEQAKKEAEVFWSKAFSKCGDSFYGVYATPGHSPSSNPMIYQLKEASIFTYHDMEEKVITEADKLNGFEWQGTTSVFSKAYRYTMAGKWVEWINGFPLDRSTFRVPIRKVKGKWVFGISETSDRFLAIPCSEIPPE